MSSSTSNRNSNSIFISVSEEEEDEINRPPIRLRRKRRKTQWHRSQLLLRLLLKYWMILIFLPAAGLVLFEASSIRKRSGLDQKLEHLNIKKLDLKVNSTTDESKKKTEGNLDRIDPPRCLKLLPHEELQHLEIPFHDEFSSPVKNVVYLSDKDALQGEGNNTLSELQRADTRFNLFTGDQTLEQRERSFKVSETAELHCGFYSASGGFKISGEDKNYMKTCKVVVSTCAFGGGDNLYQPIGMSDTSLQKVCYVAFWDEITLEAQKSKGRRIGEEHFIGRWRIVIVGNLPFIDQRLNGKIPKMLGHRLFPHAKYSIWVDSKSQFRRDPIAVLEALLWRSNSVLAISQHGARSNVYEEAKAVVNKHKATPEEVEVQLTQYRRDGLPEEKRINGKKALFEASVIVRKHSPMTNMFMCLWFNEAVRFTSRDQLSFPYVLWRLKLVKNINVFPVCIRKDLVNSMGHIRKAKPLLN